MRQRVLGFLKLAAPSAVALWCSALGAVPPVPQFQLRDTRGILHTTAEWRGAQAIVLFFVTADCPVTNSYVPEMNRIQTTFTARGVRFFAVDAGPNTTPAAAAAYATDYHYGFPLLLDPRQVLVQLTGATVTPQAVVLAPDGNLIYRGRIDNRVADFGSRRPEATVHDLRDALDAVLAGKAVPQPFTKSIGCAITKAR
jgi:peroxiredoxin